MAHNIHSILNKVVIKREEAIKVTKGGIVIPETATKKPQVGHIIAKGPDVSDKQVKLGDKVLFDRYVGVEFSVDGIEYTSMMFKDIMCVLEEIDAPQDQSVGQTEE